MKTKFHFVKVTSKPILIRNRNKLGHFSRGWKLINANFEVVAQTKQKKAPKISTKIIKRGKKIVKVEYRVETKTAQIKRVTPRNVKTKTNVDFFDLCTDDGRRDFYHQVSKDYRSLGNREDLSDVDISNIRVRFNILLKGDKVIVREFKSLSKLRNFLQLNEQYNPVTDLPEFSRGRGKNAICKLTKDVALQISRFSELSERKLKPITIIKYNV